MEYKMSAKESQITYIQKYVAEQMPRLAYHNVAHAQRVAHTSYFLGAIQGVNREDQFLLETAGWLHDIVYKPFAKNNEDLSAVEGERLMSLVGYTPSQIDTVKQLILSTKVSATPGNFLEQIIKDADMWNLGTPEFFEKSEAVRSELGLPADAKWYVGLKKLIDGQEFYTPMARQLLLPQLLANRRAADALYNSLVIPAA
ncbi:MAG TPA: hypothetical protein VK158_03795 [Acidobacteriota bacterium]|nr:hypothetical protein [Acidobacteriota bacterium]